jgi:hypothetical protein
MLIDCLNEAMTRSLLLAALFLSNEKRGTNAFSQISSNGGASAAIIHALRKPQTAGRKSDDNHQARGM